MSTGCQLNLYWLEVLRSREGHNKTQSGIATSLVAEYQDIFLNYLDGRARYEDSLEKDDLHSTRQIWSITLKSSEDITILYYCSVSAVRTESHVHHQKQSCLYEMPSVFLILYHSRLPLLFCL